MSHENPLWGAPCLHGELLKLGIEIGETSVSKYMKWRQRPPSQTWRTFLENHVKDLVSVDFFTVPTLRFQVLNVFLVLAHDRRRIIHVNVTAHPTAAWTTQQLRDAFLWNDVPRYLLHDRDGIFDSTFRADVEALGINDVRTAPHAPWQRACVERVTGSIRRECLDHVIVLNEASLRRTMKSYLVYCHEWRTHLSLDKDAPVPRAPNRQPAARSCTSHTSAVCITTTNVAPPDRRFQRRITWLPSPVVRPLCTHEAPRSSTEKAYFPFRILHNTPSEALHGTDGISGRHNRFCGAQPLGL